MKRKHTRSKVPARKAAVQQKKVAPVPAGYRSIEDPFDHVWHFATRKEDLSMAELKKRAAQASKAG